MEVIFELEEDGKCEYARFVDVDLNLVDVKTHLNSKLGKIHTYEGITLELKLENVSSSLWSGEYKSALDFVYKNFKKLRMIVLHKEDKIANSVTELYRFVELHFSTIRADGKSMVFKQVAF
ncbi:hypothetical protein Ac42p051 [Acinetobacter phage Ac42]|uniref:hypothetical protein n=1 Tax=Acinetobacter phage Ac42 TaxID=762660 RepID=UPI0001EBCC95|nr:hypothetical protein Ac42p051 [Acinetobacter phage Ac42]ADI96289.1 hypothetical protein Ac42p051 [Acinetobacter phage Ac42]